MFLKDLSTRKYEPSALPRGVSYCHAQVWISKFHVATGFHILSFSCQLCMDRSAFKHAHFSEVCLHDQIYCTCPLTRLRMIVDSFSRHVKLDPKEMAVR